MAKPSSSRRDEQLVTALNAATTMLRCGPPDIASAARTAPQLSDTQARLEQLRLAGVVAPMHLHRILADLYELTGDYRRALYHLRCYSGLRIEELEQEGATSPFEPRHPYTPFHRQPAGTGDEKELQRMALRLARRNELLQVLRSKVEPVAEKGRGEARRLAASILSHIDAALPNSDEWKSFEEIFDEVQADFLRKLRANAPDLTPTELKICIMIRMNLSTKHIADLLFSADDTVKTHRKHIRKKLGLPRGTNLMSYLLLL